MAIDRKHLGKVSEPRVVDVEKGNAGKINYSSAKPALIGMTKTMSKESGRYKVGVNYVALGFIETRLTKANDDPQTRIEIEGETIQAGVPGAVLSARETMVPLSRAGTPEKAAGAVYLFCIPDSDYISGQAVLVGGGISL